VAVPSSGGQPETLVALDEKLGEYAQSPSLIADGRAVLFSLRTSPDAWDVGPIVVQELESGRRKVIVTAGTDPTLLSTGHVVFTRRAALFAVPFDPVRLEVTGAEVPVLEGIRQAPPAASGAAQWVWSRSGSVAFIPGEESVTDRALTWIDRKGGEERTPAPFRRYEFGGVGMRISPDGSQVALVIVSETTVAKGVKTGSDIWIWHMARNTLSRLTVTTLATSPVWTADSRRVCYRSETTVFCQAADGTGQPARMFSSPELAALKAVDRTAHYFLLNTTSGDIALATLGARPEEVQPLIKTAFNEGNAVLSPDGRWVAYSSNESGIGQVYVRPFPAVDAGRWQVSSAGGFEPRWSRDGKELFFLIGGAGRSEFWRVAVRAGATFDFEPPTQVARFINDPSNAYDIGADGRFLVHRPAGTPVGTTDGIREIVVIHNWREELLARVRNTAK
jgi:serine/threonine-protein kinase